MTYDIRTDGSGVPFDPGEPGRPIPVLRMDASCELTGHVAHPGVSPERSFLDYVNLDGNVRGRRPQ